jgi:hypothetical protein
MDDLIPLDDAAARLGIEPKRLRGYLIRNGIGDPIGGATPDGIMVYAWSLESTRKRLADTSNAGQP